MFLLVSKESEIIDVLFQNEYQEDDFATFLPLIDGSNYTYWKMGMRAFINSLDDNAWIACEEGWSSTTILDVENNEV